MNTVSSRTKKQESGRLPCIEMNGVECDMKGGYNYAFYIAKPCAMLRRTFFDFYSGTE